jgi:predicted CXXCH cytochrome family protein
MGLRNLPDITHKAGASADAEFRYHLTKASPALCTECHDPKDAQIVKAHQGQPIEKADCLTCHDPHQSAAPKLMRAFMHSPFESTSCDTCHKPAKDGKVLLTAASVKELCVTCHDDEAKEGVRRSGLEATGHSQVHTRGTDRADWVSSGWFTSLKLHLLTRWISGGSEVVAAV